MASSPVLENLIGGQLIKENGKASADVMDVVRVVQAMNQSSSTISKNEFDSRKRMVLETLASFLSALQIELQTGSNALGNSDSFLSQFVLGSGAPAKRLLRETIPTAIRVAQKIESHVREDLEHHGHFFQPTGPAAVFLGWSDPMLSFIRKIPLLFASGNGVCVKPSRKSAKAVMALGKLWQNALDRAGVPPGMFSILNGDETLGEVLLQHPSFKNIHWIGRSESALKAQQVALGAGKRFYFSGSGRNPLILFAPAGGRDELDRILESVVDLGLDPHGWGPYRPSRLFIQESIYKESLEILAAKLDAAKCGDPRDLATDLGPIPDSSALRFEEQLKLALSETGKLVTGGGRVSEANGKIHEGWSLMQPTLVRDLTNCSTLQGEELEGVFLTAASFKYQHEAVKYSNTSPLGLAGFVIHSDQEKIKAMAARLETSRLIGSAQPDRSEILCMEAAPAKNSASSHDGIRATYEQGRYHPGLSILRSATE